MGNGQRSTFLSILETETNKKNSKSRIGHHSCVNGLCEQHSEEAVNKKFLLTANRHFYYVCHKDNLENASWSPAWIQSQIKKKKKLASGNSKQLLKQMSRCPNYHKNHPYLQEYSSFFIPDDWDISQSNKSNRILVDWWEKSLHWACPLFKSDLYQGQAMYSFVVFILLNL